MRQSLTIMHSSNVVVSGLTSVNSQTIHIAIAYSNNVRVQNARIIAPSGSPNTDGIHVQNSMGVTITDSTIRTGDDCISIGPGSMNLWIQKIGCGPGHGIRYGITYQPHLFTACSSIPLPLQNKKTIMILLKLHDKRYRLWRPGYLNLKDL